MGRDAAMGGRGAGGKPDSGGTVIADAAGINGDDAASTSPADGGAIAEVGTAAGDSAAAPGDASGGPFPGAMSLFDGKTLGGWLQGGGRLWSVVDGALDAKGTTGGELLMTAQDYGDFRLFVTVRMPMNTGRGHLGICFWGGRTPIGSYNGCKLYVPPNAGDWDYGGGGRLRGVTVAMQDPPLTPTSPLDPKDWHRVEMLCRLATGSCQVGVDGKPIMTYKEPSPGSLKRGPIGLQIHAGTSQVQYKDVFIDPAPVGEKLLSIP